MNAAVGPDWLDQHVLPEIQNMLVQDAYFKLMGYARQLTGEFNGAVAGLMYAGYHLADCRDPAAVRQQKRRDFAAPRARGSEEDESDRRREGRLSLAETRCLPKHRRPCR